MPKPSTKIAPSLLAASLFAIGLPAQYPAQTPQNMSYSLGASGSTKTNVAAKLNSVYEAAADFGADPSGATDATAASQAAIMSALAAGTCAHFLGGRYQLSYSSVASLTFPSNSCLKGDGHNQTVFLERTPGATIMAVTGHNVFLKDFFIAMEPRVSATEATGLSLYPNLASTTQVDYTRVEDVSISSQWCNEDTTEACQKAANGNRLLYGVLLQSGVKDNTFNTFTNLYVRWAQEGVYLLSGGLKGSSGNGTVGASSFVNSYFANVTDCAKLAGSGENFFLATQCTDARHAQFVLGSNPFGGTYGSAESVKNYIQTFGESNSALADFASAAINTIDVQYDEADSGNKGNFLVLGKEQSRNSINAPGIFQTGFYDISGDGKSIDPFVCAGMIDFVNAPCTATIDFSASANNPVIVRLRGITTGSRPYDYYNLSKSTGHVWRDSPTSPLTVPVATFQKMITTGTASNAFVRFLSGTSDAMLGDVNFALLNSSTTAATVFLPGVVSSSGTEVYPWGVQGNGVYQNNQAMTSASQLPTCGPDNVAAEVHNYAFATSNTWGALPGSGGSFDVAIRCGYNGSTYQWTIFAK